MPADGGSEECGKGPNESGGSITIPKGSTGPSKGRRQMPSIGMSKFPVVQRVNGLGNANKYKSINKGQMNKYG
jgi:hypothetical protein